MRGVYSFPFFRNMFVCVLVCKLFFSSRISQQLLYLGVCNLVQTLSITSCIVKKRISILMLVIHFICPFLFLSHKNHHRFSPAIRARVFKFCIHPDNGVRENQDSEIFSFLPIFSM